MTPALVCVALACCSAIVHLVAYYRGPKWLVFAAKPTTTTLLVLAALTVPAVDGRERVLIVAGLLLSLAGDVFLLFPHRFAAGLASFLLAHLAYSVAFWRPGAAGHLALLVPYVGVAAVMLALLWPRLGKLRIPVIAYVTALVVMAWLAAARWTDIPGQGTLIAAVGAALFVLSDGTLAMNRFHTSFRAAQAVVMTTYVASQSLIAVSISSILR